MPPDQRAVLESLAETGTWTVLQNEDGSEVAWWAAVLDSTLMLPKLLGLLEMGIMPSKRTAFRITDAGRAALESKR